MSINIKRRFVFICLLILQADEPFAQNVTDSAGLKQGYWEYYPDSIFIPGTMMFWPNSKQKDFIYYMNHCAKAYTDLPDSFKVKTNFASGLLHGKYEVYDDTFLVFSGFFDEGMAHQTFYEFEYDFFKEVGKCIVQISLESRYYYGKLDGPTITWVTYYSSIFKKIDRDVIRIVFYDKGKLSHDVYSSDYGKKRYQWIRKGLWNKWYDTKNKTIGKKK